MKTLYHEGSSALFLFTQLYGLNTRRSGKAAGKSENHSQFRILGAKTHRTMVKLRGSKLSWNQCGSNSSKVAFRIRRGRMQLTCASHHFGENAISTDLYEPIITMLNKLDFEVQKGSAAKLRQRISEELFQLGWSDKTKIDSENDITITSMKGNIGLCMQTGNVSRFYADILKLQFMYIKDKVTAAIYISYRQKLLHKKWAVILHTLKDLLKS